jgi:type IV pilus assembly protein PilV
VSDGKLAVHIPRQRIAGFSIVEVLVALVVLSIGMLGIAALYVESLRAGRSAVYRTQAVNLASDMADRIRANRNAQNAYALAAAATPTEQGCSPTPDDDTPVACTPGDLAQDDMARWRAAIADQLPGNGQSTPTGTITVTVPPNAAQTRMYSIQVTWSEPGEPALTYVLNMQI